MSEGVQGAKRYVVFAVGDLRLAVEVDNVVRVVQAVEITPLRGVAGVMDGAVAGTVSLRGTDVAVIDMRRRLGLPPRELQLEDRFVLVQRGVWQWFLVGDAVIGLVELPAAALRRRDGDPVDCRSADVRLEDGVVSVLDVGRLLGVEEAQRVRRAMAQRSVP